jgi:hypothetical protein
MMDKDMNRFMDKVDVTEKCWFWKNGKSDSGYGVFHWRSKSIRAHRFIWISKFGDIPNNMHVLHKCDNRLCVNPDHLFLGTHQDNMIDRNEKGRTAVQRGEKCGTSKLTEKEVKEIKDHYTKKEMSQYQLAKKYNVHQSVISRAINGKTWF